MNGNGEGPTGSKRLDRIEKALELLATHYIFHYTPYQPISHSNAIAVVCRVRIARFSSAD